MASVNKAIILGFVGKDPDVREISSGTKVASLSIATTRRFKDSSGQKQEETDWHRISLFGRLAEIAQQYVTKGSLLYVEGRLHTRKYTDAQGIERFVTEILGESIQLMPKSDGKPSGGTQAQTRTQQATRQQPQQLDDDDIPF